MKHGAKSLLLGLVAAAGLAAAPAQAQLQFGRMDTGLYLGGSIGGAKYKDTCDGIAGGGVSCDEKDTAWKAFAGWQFTRHIGLEVGYTDLGKATASAGATFIEAKVRGVELTGVVSWPFTEQFAIFGKAGAYFSDVDINSNIAGVSASDRNTDFTFGAGARFNFTRNFAARAEWQRYQNVGGGSVGSDDIDFYGISLLYTFY